MKLISIYLTKMQVIKITVRYYKGSKTRRQLEKPAII